MRIAIINTVCKYGSTGRLAYGLYRHAVENGHKCKLFYGRGETYKNNDLVLFEKKYEVYEHALLARLTGKQGFFSKKATYYLLNQLDEFGPDVVVLMNIHGYYLNMPMLFTYIQKMDLPVIQMLYDEFSFTGHCAFTGECQKFKSMCDENFCKRDYPKSWFFSQSNYMWNVKKSFYDSNDSMKFLGAPYVANKARESGLLKNKDVVILDEGDELKDIFYPHDATKLKDSLGIPKDNIVILDVAPYSSARKGVPLFYELARRLQDRRDITFVHVGMDVKLDKRPDNIVSIGYINNLHTLSDYYAMSDLFVCTSFADTVPNTCIEALGCGVHICGFNISGIPYSACSPFGEYVEPGDLDGLEKIIRRTKKKTIISINSTRDYALKRYDKDVHFSGIINEAKKLIERCYNE